MLQADFWCLIQVDKLRQGWYNVAQKDVVWTLCLQNKLRKNGVFPLEACNYIAKVHAPFVIAENLKQFYYKGLAEWRNGAQVRLKDTCGTGQDVFKAFLTKFGYSWLVKGAEL